MLKTKAASSAKITSFFSPATKRQHELQVRIANDNSLLADENKREDRRSKKEATRSKEGKSGKNSGVRVRFIFFRGRCLCSIHGPIWVSGKLWRYILILSAHFDYYF
jgi:hypothetical protein